MELHLHKETGGKRYTIAVDCDEVLGYFVEPMTKFYNRVIVNDKEKYPHRYHQPVAFPQFISYQFSKSWGGTDEEATQIVEEFFQSEEFLNQPPIPGALEVLSKLKQKYRLVVITSRQFHLETITRKFLDTNYPDIFDELFLGNHYAKTGPKLQKSELVQLSKADVLIDDSILYCRQCSEHHIKCVLFGQYPWNEFYDSGRVVNNQFIRQANDWNHVAEIIHDYLEEELPTPNALLQPQQQI